MSFLESEMSHSLTQNSEMDSCGEYGSSQSGGSSGESDEGDEEGSGDSKTDDHEGTIESTSQIHDSDDHSIEHDKISGKDSDEEGYEGFPEFFAMMEQDKEVIGKGASESQELGDKITFYPKSDRI